MDSAHFTLKDITDAECDLAHDENSPYTWVRLKDQFVHDGEIVHEMMRAIDGPAEERLPDALTMYE